MLSTSAVRGRIAERFGSSVRIEPGWTVPDGFFRGYAFSLLGGSSRTVIRHEGKVLELDGPVEGNGAFELRSPEEAPVLAARLVTGTPLDQPLPEIAMRLATTRGTNALLERKGAPTVLFITRGFADLLLIGDQQRPDIFALDIRKPRPLYEKVVEVTERLAADGSVLVPLDLRIEPLPGIETAAVALMHSYRNPVHEEAVGELLREAGFRHVSLSSQLAPLIKIVPRAETAVVDAYLSPILEDYLNRVGSVVSNVHVMTSAGGLVRAGSFHAKDSLLSGPAGGVVGAALSGRRSGFDKIIAFDMGGTSTDVARYDGDFEYLFEHRVGDAHLVAPALAIESVAAGGGSICGFDGAQLRVGPESAGAWPGPACYGAGGPLTLTDVNLILGRLDPDRFEIPLDAEAAERALEKVGAKEMLDGFLEIANERMAEAIRSISLRRGYDPAEYALVAFGGAGAQHACALAELLGIGHVIVPRDAGLLSALGLGAAVVERFAHRQVLEPLKKVKDRLPGWLDELGREALEAVAAEGVAGVVRRRILNLRFAGQDEALAIESEPIEEAFAAAYREVYGYAPEGRAIELESIRVVASSAEEQREELETVHEREAEPSGTRRCWLAGEWSQVPFYDRARLAPGDRFQGPALVFESHSATFVAPGWRGRVDAAWNLVIDFR